MPPKRMSDILQSSSIDTRIHSDLTPTTAPNSSEGPTLPLIGAVNEHGTSTPQNGKKRKRTTVHAHTAKNKNKNAATMNPMTNPKANTTERKSNPPLIPTRTNHPSLYEPWTLLPDRQRREMEKRGSEKVLCVVYSRNQNVKAGINKLVRWLGVRAGVADAADMNSQSAGNAWKDEEGMIAVSAQGEGTVKLVGIVDMVRRIIEELQEGDGVTWFTYTVLSSVVVPRKKGSGHAASTADEALEEGGGAVDVDAGNVDAMDVDADNRAVKETQDSKEEAATKTVPVLTVWMTRKRIPGWKDAFGEQELVVRESPS